MSASPRFPNDATPVPDGQHLRSLPRTAGFTDGLGERQLVFDPASSTSLELLRFKREFSSSPEFEGALLARIEALNHVSHPSLATVHGVERTSESELALVSRHVAGRRVSDLLPKAHGPAFALELIRLVTPALALLQRAGDEVAHGALSADRIIVTRDGRLVVVEHVLGSALESLRLPRQKLIELGLAVPTGPIHFSSKTDLTQLGFIALSLLLGRKLDPANYPDKVPALLDEFSRTAGSPVLAAKLRSWLERAMQLSPRSFASARDAQDAFGDLPDDGDVQAAAIVTGLDAFPQEVGAAADAAVRPNAGATNASPSTFSPTPDVPIDRRGPIDDRREQKPQKGRRLAIWMAAGLGVIAAAEGVALFVVPYMRPAAEVVEVQPPQNLAAPAQTPVAAVTPTPAPVEQALAPPAAAGTAALAGARPGDATTPSATPTATPAPASGPRFGGVTVVSAMDLQVYENGKAVGSTAGPVALNEGARNLEFVNDAVGFRFRQTVNVKSGQMTTVNIAVPNGRISINAAPWAEVDIDGTPAGDTPLANLSLPVGTHEITFRHPQLGVRKQTVVVKVEGLTRVTQVFQPETFK